MFQELQSLYIVNYYKRYRTDEFQPSSQNSDVVDLMCWGSLFQTEAAATTKARSPIEERWVAAMASNDEPIVGVFGHVQRPRVGRRMTRAVPLTHVELS